MKAGSRSSRLGGVLAMLVMVAVGTVGLTTFGWLPNLGWHSEPHDSLVTEVAGTLGKIDPDTNTVHIDATPSRRDTAAFVVTADTRLMVDNKEAGLADLREGMHVKVVYERRDDTRLAWSVEASTAQDAQIAEAVARPSAAPSPAVPDFRPAKAVSGQSQVTQPSRAADPASPIQAPSPGPPPKSSRAHSPMSTRAAASGLRPKLSVEGDTSRSGRRAADSQARTGTPLVVPPAGDESANGEAPTRAQDSPRSQERESDPSAVIDWLLKDRGQTSPGVSGR